MQDEELEIQEDAAARLRSNGGDDGGSLEEDRQEAKDWAIFTWGSAKIVERRLRFRKAEQAFWQFAPAAVVLALGALLMVFGPAWTHLPLAINIATVTSVVLSVLGYFRAPWREISVYTNSLIKNERLSREAHNFMKDPPAAPKLREERHRSLERQVEDQERIDSDYRPTEAEKRFGYRAGLLHYGFTCGSCGKVPRSMKQDGHCPSCGGRRE